MIEDRFVYFFLPIPFLILSAVIFLKRKDLRRRIIKIGLLGGIAGWIANIWYFIDYWQPPSLFGTAVFSIEDFLAGFGLAAVGATIYPFLTRTTPPRSVSKGRRKPFIFFITLWVVCFILFVNVLKLNSAPVSLLLVTLSAVYIIVRYPILLKQGIVVGAILTVMGGLTYFFLFGILSTGYLDRYFLLTNHPLNPTLFGFYPLLEVFWYFSWGLFATVFIDYVSLRAESKKVAKASKALS
jgi:hypothetical protein